MIEDDSIIKKERDNKWFEKYNSKINKFKRSKIILILKIIVIHLKLITISKQS